MDIYYTENGKVISRERITTFETLFVQPRIGEKVDLKGIRWTVKDVIWDLEESQVEFVLES